jgi:uncharacterized membrane protein YeiB
MQQAPIVHDSAAQVQVQRLDGVDLARALAMIGMLAVHIGPENVPDFGGRVYALAHGRASVLFVLVAGVGISLLAPHCTRHRDARLKLAWMALVLLPLGLALQKLDHPVAVILHHYSAFFLLGLCLLGVPKRQLLALAVMITALAPLLYLTGRMLEPELFARKAVSISNSPGAILLALLVSGPYPLLTWSAPLVWGMWLGRLDLRKHTTRLAICLAGAGMAVLAPVISGLLVAASGAPRSNVEWRYLLVDTAHSQMPLWLISATGSALFVLGGTLFLADRWRKLVHPLVALGQMALTMYVAHLLVLIWWGRKLTQEEVVPAAITVLLLTTAAMVFALAWQRFMRRGPIEALIHLPWQLARAASGGRESGDGPASREAPGSFSPRAN